MAYRLPVLYTHRYDSPVGNLFLAVDRKGAVLRLGYTDDASLAERYHVEANAYACGELAYQLDEYFRGERKRFTVDLVLEGTEFQLSVWHRLLKIPYGSVMTYGEVAQKVGRKNAARAVGNAVATNQLPILVPCHRVLPASGGVGQYALRSFGDGTGSRTKSFLLELERKTVEADSDRTA
ncbi:methylated-DNA--[protein]-cysteine S-methyltransferase [Salinispira pacifica]